METTNGKGERIVDAWRFYRVFDALMEAWAETCAVQTEIEMRQRIREQHPDSAALSTHMPTTMRRMRDRMWEALQAVGALRHRDVTALDELELIAADLEPLGLAAGRRIRSCIKRLRGADPVADEAPEVAAAEPARTKPLLRTQDEIVARINETKGDDPLGFGTGDLVEQLDFDHALPFLKPEANTPEDRRTWNEQALRNVTEIRQRLIDYLPFAREKAEGERGISATRSQQHFRAWLWLIGEDDLLRQVEAIPYDNYGIARIELLERHFDAVPTS